MFVNCFFNAVNTYVEDLLNVGRATKKKFLKYNINTIGDLSNTKPEFLKNTLGKRGVELWSFANG
ncbi:DNA polymerase thumb domain-containing protein [Metaclostridioides mangenotii]|uniref:DNA polymerase thumb domain-containing protein n=1 Tax=Metaclostridioides mangenotii TaxID=1540 RepID=UPI0038CBFEB7